MDINVHFALKRNDDMIPTTKHFPNPPIGFKKLHTIIGVHLDIQFVWFIEPLASPELGTEIWVDNEYKTHIGILWKFHS